MKRNLHAANFASFLAGSIFLAQSARAIDTVFLPNSSAYSFSGGALEVQGFNGRIDLPVDIQQGSGPAFPFTFGGAVTGAAANGTTLFTLVNDTFNTTDDSVIVTSNAQTGAYLGWVQLNTRVTDIAYTNGQLYGVLPNQNALQIDSIAGNGTTQNVVNISEPSFTGTWRLSGVVSGDNLLASQSTTAENSVGYLVSPTSPLEASPIAVFGSTGYGTSGGTVFSADGNTITTAGQVQIMTSLPGDTFAGPRAFANEYGSTGGHAAISDEFNYAYGPSQPAYVSIASDNASWAPGVDGLYRLPQVLSTTQTFYLDNGIAPDGVTLSDVSASNSVTQVSGPTPFTITEQNNPTGDFSYRQIGTATMTLNLGTAQRGNYQLNYTPNMIANYSYGSTVDVGRSVQSPNYEDAYFAYDPISSNIVGNGDATLNAAGWESRFGDTGTWFSQDLLASPSEGFSVVPPSSGSSAIRQFLQLPTADAPMLLSFTGQFDKSYGGAGTPVEVQVDLNDKMIDDVFVDSGPLQTFSAEITDPSLQNLNNAVLMFYLPEQTFAAEIDLDNISLTAVPEPASCTSAIVLAGICLARRSRRGA